MKQPLFNPEPFSAGFSAKPDTRVHLFTFGDSTHGAWGQTAGQNCWAQVTIGQLS